MTAGEGKFRRTVFVLGKNPAKADVVAYLATLPNSTGFDQVIDQESHFKNFINADNEPVVAGDAGYGMTQMTPPHLATSRCGTGRKTYKQVLRYSRRSKPLRRNIWVSRVITIPTSN